MSKLLLLDQSVPPIEQELSESHSKTRSRRSLDGMPRSQRSRDVLNSILYNSIR